MQLKLSDSLKAMNHGHFWCFVANRALNDNEIQRIERSVSSFLGSWTAHGEPVYSAHQWLGEQLLVVGADLTKCSVSGCGKDALVQHIQEIGRQLQIDFFDRTLVGLISDAHLSWVHFTDVKGQILQGKIDGTSYVVNSAIAASNDIENDLFIKIEESWMKRFLPEQVSR